MRISSYALAVVATWVACAQAHGESRHFDNVLGTSMDITIVSSDSEATAKGFDDALAEVLRLESVFSSYLPNSELSRLNRDGTLDSLSADLQAVVAACIEWEAATKGSFSCKMGAIREQWRQAVAEQTMPSRRDVRALARRLTLVELPAPDSAPFALPEPIKLDVAGLAKGYIIDQVAAVIQRTVPDASGIKVDIGGDAVYRGNSSDSDAWQIGLTTATADGDAKQGVVRISNQGIAASGHQARTMDIGRKSLSHILSTRDGWPVAQKTASYVIADSAMNADAIATMAASRSPAETIQWAETREDIDLLLVLESGRQLASSRWRSNELVDARASATNMMVTYEIPKQDAGKYRRPYVAVWISDESRAPIRNLLLLGDSNRWAQENRKWWRAVGRDDRDILDGYARSTRRPGTYTVQWDGRDDRGRLVTGTKFRLHLEAAREHGGHTYKTVDIDLSDPVDTRIQGDGEFGTISIAWQSERKASTDAEKSALQLRTRKTAKQTDQNRAAVTSAAFTTTGDAQ